MASIVSIFPTRANKLGATSQKLSASGWWRGSWATALSITLLAAGVLPAWAQVKGPKVPPLSQPTILECDSPTTNPSPTVPPPSLRARTVASTDNLETDSRSRGGKRLFSPYTHRLSGGSGDGLPLSGSMEQVSVASDGSLGNGNSGRTSNPYSEFVSGDGRFVTFSSDASNLVSGDTRGLQDVFLRDRQLGTTTRISAGPNGEEANGWSQEPTISSDGRYIAFKSIASNLVPADCNESIDIFVYDRLSGLIERVSLSSTGSETRAGFSAFPSLSDDGRYVAFISEASDLVPGDTNGERDVFVHDRESDTTTRVSVSSEGQQGNEWSFEPSISDDGRYIAFTSDSTNFVANDTAGTRDAFLHDRLTKTTTLVSRMGAGPSVNGDGRYVAFASNSKVTSDDNDDLPDVFVFDRHNGVTTNISAGSESGSINRSPSISGDGRYVAFGSDGGIKIFDMTTQTTHCVAQGETPSISADGHTVAFTKWYRLDPDSNLFSRSDVFVVDGDWEGAGCGGAAPPTDSIAPRIHSVGIAQPSSGDGLLMRGLIVDAEDNEGGSGLEGFEYTWEKGWEVDQPDGLGDTMFAEASFPSVSYRGAAPNSRWSLFVRPVDSAGNRGSWLSIDETTPQSPGLFVLGDSIAAGHHRDDGERITTCEDADYAYGRTVADQLDGRLPEAWGTPIYVNYAYSGTTTEQVLIGGGKNACNMKVPSRSLRNVQDALESRRGSWNYVAVTAGANDTEFSKAIRDVVKSPRVFTEDGCREAVRKWKGFNPSVISNIRQNVAAISKLLTNADPAVHLAWTSYYNIAGTGLVPASCEAAVDEILKVIHHDAIQMGLGDRGVWVDLDMILRMSEELLQPVTLAAPLKELFNLGWPHPNRTGAVAIGEAVAASLFS